MATHSSASTLTHDIRSRALRIINNNSYDYYTRQFIRYALNINDPWTPEMVRRSELGEDVVQDPSIEYDSSENHSEADDSIEYHLEGK